MNYFQQKISIIILLASLAIAVSIFLYGKEVYNDLLQLRASETSLFTDNNDLNNHFRDFQRALGFGGFIHNVKEYIVHRSPAQLTLLEANVREIETSYALINEHFPDLNQPMP